MGRIENSTVAVDPDGRAPVVAASGYGLGGDDGEDGAASVAAIRTRTLERPCPY